MTAEECLLGALFAMVSNDCHVRNAQAWTSGLGMLSSETDLADEITDLHSTARNSSPARASPFTVSMQSVCGSLCQPHHQNENHKKMRGTHQRLKASEIIVGFCQPRHSLVTTSWEWGALQWSQCFPHID